MTTVRLLPKAENDVVAAVDWYEAERDGLGVRFEGHVASTLDRVCDNPSLFPLYRQGVRRALVGTFPYGILFAETDDEILVVAVLHLHRDPNAWAAR